MKTTTLFKDNLYSLTRYPLRGLLLLLALTTLLASTTLAQKTRYVNAARPDDSGDGLSWASAYQSLQTALAAAQPGDQIWVATGTYKPTATADRTISFIMKENVKIYGGFTSGQGSLTGRDPNPATNGTVLSGDIGAENDNGDNSYHIIFNDKNGLTAAAVLDGFTLTGGNAERSGGSSSGGAMYNDNSSPSVTNCAFFNNSANLFGGAIYNYESNPVLTNCSFVSNSANYGGALYINKSSPTLTNCSFLNNAANIKGGAIRSNFESNTTLTNCSFLGNSAISEGGAMLTSGLSRTTLINCIIFGNGGENTIFNEKSSGIPIATYSLFEASETSYTDNGNNLTTTVSPFASGTELNPCSPAIDAGNDAANATATDLAGNPRKVRTIDMGAYEYRGASPVITASLGGGGAIDAGQSSGLTVTLSGGTAPYTVIYSANGGSEQTENNYQNQATITVSPAATTTYALVSVTDANGCTAATLDGGATVTVTALPQTRYVNAARPDDSGDGLSWASAYQSLQTALAAAQSGDQIWVARSTYKPSERRESNDPRSASFVMKENVKIYGGFTSGQGNLTDRDPNPATNGTVLSGDISAENDKADNSYHVVFNDQNGLTAAAVLDGFTIMGGNADGSGDSYKGGAMYNRDSNPSVTNCAFFNNSARLYGGAMYNDESNPVLTNCSFVSNSTDYGGSMYNDESSPTLTNCSFLNNTANVIGGAIRNNFKSNPTLTNCSFVDNSASSDGWAVNNDRSNLTLINCVFFGNGGENTIHNSSANGTSTTTATYTLFEASVTGYSGNDNLTTTVSPFASDTELSPCSPAIDAGNDAANATATDLAGNTRKVRTIDMGAYEYQGTLPTLTATLSGGGPICAGSDATFTVSGSAGETLTYTLTGKTGEQTLLLDGNNQTITASNATADVTLTLVRVEKDGCSQNLSGTSTVTVNPLPGLTPDPDQSVVFGFKDGDNCTDISATASGGSAPYTYQWSGSGETGGTINVCPETTTTYTVSATDANGCVSPERQVTVEVQDVRCGNKLNKVEICYYGVSQCVSKKIARRYLRLGATLGSCGSGTAARIGYEGQQTTPLQLTLKAYPNPVQDAVTVEVLSPSAGAATFQVLDLQGRTRQSRTENLIEGRNEIQFRLGALPTGVYLIRIVDALNRQGMVKVKKE